MKYLILLCLLLGTLYSFDNYYYKDGKKEYIQKLSNIARSNNAITYYKNTQGDLLGVSSYILLKTQKDIDIGAYIKEYNIDIKRVLSAQLYLLVSPNKEKTVDFSNRLSEKAGVIYAHPDFIKKHFKR